MARKPPPKPFQKGWAGGPGRPKGSRNKLSEKFLTDLCAAWEEHGMEAITKVVENQPGVFLKVVASLVPKEWHIKNAGAFEEMSEDDLVRALAQVRSLVSAGVRSKAQNDAAAEEGKPKPDSVH